MDSKDPQDDLAELLGWVDRIVAHPEDGALREVFSDWLLEHGRSVEAEWLRLEGLKFSNQLDSESQEQFRAAASQFKSKLRARLARAPVENCVSKVPLAFECPQRWEAMTPLDNPEVRRCTGCKKDVFWTDTIESAVQHAKEGHCIAVAPSLMRAPGDVVPVPWPLNFASPGVVAMPYPAPGESPPEPLGKHERPVSWWRRLLGLK